MSTNHSDIEGTPSGEEPLLTVGHWLKQAREQKGESLEDVSKVTRIGKNYLEALEEGASARLPSLAYCRGFIRLYASHLGLSPDEAIRMLTNQPVLPAPGDQPETAPATNYRRPASRQSSGTGTTKKIGLALVGALVLAGVILSIANRNNPTSSTTTNPAEKSTTPPVTPTAPSPGQASPTATASPATTPQPPGNAETLAEGGLVLRLKAVSAGRLHITIDGSISQEYDLVAGDLVEWKAENQFLLDLENAGSVEADLDGKPLPAFGGAGKAAHLLIRQNGVQQN